MGKSKTVQAEKPAKVAEVKALSSVKGGAVTKPSQTPKSKSKELAKQVAAKSDAGDKKSKKSKKEPTPEPSSESESDSDEDMSSASSADSNDESEDEAVPVAKTNGAVSNGVAKNAGGDTSDSSESSDDEDEPAVAGAPKGAISADSSDDDSADDSEDHSGDGSDAESDDEVAKPNGATDAQALKGKLGEVATKQASSAESDSGSDDSSDAESAAGSSSDSDESSEGDDEEEKEKVEGVPSKKRKADAEPAPVAKKVKAEAPVANGDGGETGNLFVGNLSWNVDEEWLAREFESFGELKSTRIITDRESGRSKGFGYVEFVDPADGAKAHAAKKGAELDGRTINVDFATARKEKQAGGFQERSNKYGDQTNEPSTTIFCANLAFGATQDDVSDAFGEHAPVSAVRIPTDRESGQPKGFAYVEFGSIEDAVAAFEGMKGASISGRSIRVDYASSRPRNDDGGRGGRGGFGGGRGRGGFDRGGRGGGRGRGGFDRGGGRGGRGGSTNRGGFGDFKGKKMTF